MVYSLIEYSFDFLGKSNQKSSDESWLRTVLSSGTLNDRVAANTMLLQVVFCFLIVLEYFFTVLIFFTGWVICIAITCLIFPSLSLFIGVSSSPNEAPRKSPHNGKEKK